jgi:hypothetical protein
VHKRLFLTSAKAVEKHGGRDHGRLSWPLKLVLSPF